MEWYASQSSGKLHDMIIKKMMSIPMSGRDAIQKHINGDSIQWLIVAYLLNIHAI